MSVSWTEEQQAAIDTRGCNLLVAAAAGSGKTAVLVERIIKMITDNNHPIDIDRLLIVTFTNAAAAEMRERIGDAIGKKLEENPYNHHLQKQLTLIHRASIMTIHSFCLEVIRNNFHLIDLDPSFRIADATEATLLKAEVMEELLEDLYNREHNENFLGLVESYGGAKQDRKLEEIILRIYEFVQSNPWPEVWIQEMTELFNLKEEHPIDDTPWGKVITAQVQIEIQGLLGLARRAFTLSQKPYGPEGYSKALQSDIQLLQGLYEASKKSLEQLFVKFQEVSFEKLGRCSKEVDDKQKEEVKKIRDKEIKKGIQNLQEKIFFKPLGLMKKDIKKTYPLLRCLGEVIIEFGERYKAIKLEKALLDFSDIEHYALDILLDSTSTPEQLIPSNVATELQEKYEEILIDEYQDSNLVQETLLTSIARIQRNEPNMFMVGDVKQSIYRFRLAKPELFMEKYKTYGADLQAKEKRIDLFKNFRSREEVIDGVNYLFRQMMSESVGEIEYDERAALYLGASFEENATNKVGGPIEFHIIEQELSEENEEDLSEEQQKLQEELGQINNIELEAKIVAKRIKQLVFGGEETQYVFDKHLKKYRPAEFRDIVILLRATSRWAHVFVEELVKENIPAYADISTGYFEAVEVQIILSLLQIIDNPRQDIPLITILRSPVVALTEDELVEIRTNFKEGTYYDAVRQYLEEEWEESSLGAKVRNFIDNLERWREISIHVPIDELLRTVYRETNYYNYVGAMPGGVQRQANLRALVDRGAKYEATSYKGLFHFVRFMKKLEGSQGDMGAAKTLGENENLVKIMSIHKSKGLEFPIVFVSGLGKQFNLMDLRQSILLHQDLGFGPDYVDYENRVSYKTMAKAAIYQKIALENLSEEMRVLYVALTRAKEKLILTGSTKNVEEEAKKWCRYIETQEEQLPPYFLMKAKTYLDWLGPAIARHQDGYYIRKWAGIEEEPTNPVVLDSSKWEVRGWTKEDIILEEIYDREEQEQLRNELEQWDTDKIYSEYHEEIQKRLSWEYAYEQEVTLPMKVSVSEVKRQYQQEELIQDSVPLQMEGSFLKPLFMEEKRGFSAAEKGTIVHLVMQHLNYENMEDFQSIEMQLREMEKRGLLTEEERKVVFIKDLLTFGKSDLINRIKKGSNLKKEVPFVLGIPILEVFPAVNYEDEMQEKVLIQGVIDCYFEEEDEIVLVDYKTDYIKEIKEVSNIQERYRKQIELYTKAIEQITGKIVKEKILYLFSIGKAVSY